MHATPDREGLTGGSWSFVRRLLGTAALVIVGAFALNVLADPGRQWGIELLPLDPSDARAVKLEVIQRAPRGFDTVVLADSRGQRMEPSHIQRRIGGRALNAGYPGANFDAMREAWELATRRSDRIRRVLVLGGGEDFAFRQSRHPFLTRVTDALSLEQAGRSFDAVLETAGLAQRPQGWVYAQDGLELRSAHRDRTAIRRRGGTSEAEVRLPLMGISQVWSLSNWRDGIPRFERMVSSMNQRGIEPVLVLTPYHPEMIRRAGPPFGAMRANLLRLLRGLQRRHRFVVVDAQIPATYRADPRGFADGTHMDNVNMRRLFDHVLAQVPELRG